MSCRTGRIPLPGDPLSTAAGIADVKSGFRVANWGLLATAGIFWYKVMYPHRSFQYKGPENPYTRFRHRRFPAGAVFFGWGNNGLNRDCNLKEYECWSGYVGKEYTY